MELSGVVVAAAAAVPLSWLAAVFVQRIPTDDALFSPRPGVPFPDLDRRGRDLAMGAILVLSFAAMASEYERPAMLAPLLFFTWVLITLSAIDIDTLRLPDRLVFPSIGIAMVVIPLASWSLGDMEVVKYAALGGLGYFGFLLIAHLLYPPGMGFGDVKLSFFMGLFLGWLTAGWVETAVLVLYAMLFGFVLGSIAGIVAFIMRGRSAGYPFGPFLALGALLAVLFADPLLHG